MKKNLFTMILTFVTTTSFNSILAQSETQNGAIITFTKDIIDFGTIKYRSNNPFIFEFTNLGNAPLFITNVKGCGGCAAPEWPREAIPPGAKSEIKVVYDTKKAGPILKSVTIFSNAVNDPVKVVIIKGSVAAAVEGAPASPTN